MSTTEKILKVARKIHGGALLPHLKGTAELEAVIMPASDVVKIPMQQHIGAPSKPIVKKGDKVFVGTLIGEAGGFVGAPVHSSVSGEVKGIENYTVGGKTTECVVIESDGEMTVDKGIKPFTINSKEDIAAAADACGLVGLGGAGFPTKVKLTLKEETPIDTLIINGAECEPYITSDYRACIEDYESVIEGVYLLKEKLNIPNVIICIESNKEQAIKLLAQVASDRRDEDDSVKLMKLPTSYPQGAEKVIVYSATGRQVPMGKLPADVGCIVMNITSVVTLYKFIKTGMPLVSKRITVDGTAVKEPKNIIVPIGTAVKDVLEFVGGVTEDAAEVIFGGPMMGVSADNTDMVIEKRTNAITVMSEALKPAAATPCIRCGRCAGTCPMHLYPAKVESAMNHGLKDTIPKLNVNCCMECGSCSFICPAKRPLTQVMRTAKLELRRQSK